MGYEWLITNNWDADLIPSNIKSWVAIFGVTGNFWGWSTNIVPVHYKGTFTLTDWISGVNVNAVNGGCTQHNGSLYFFWSLYINASNYYWYVVKLNLTTFVVTEFNSIWAFVTVDSVQNWYLDGTTMRNNYTHSGSPYHVTFNMATDSWEASGWSPITGTALTNSESVWWKNFETRGYVIENKTKNAGFYIYTP